MDTPTRWRVISVTANCVTVEDVTGEKDKKGKFPKEEFHGDAIGHGFRIGDWVGMQIYLANRPEKKEGVST